MINNNQITAKTDDCLVILHPKHRTFSVYDIARFLHEKHIVMGPIATKLIQAEARKDEVKMKSSLELKKKLAEKGLHVGGEKIPRILAKDMMHIDDDMVDILLRTDEERRYFEQVKNGNTPLSNAKECLAWFLSLAPPFVPPRPRPWELLSIEDYPLPDLSPEKPKSLELVKLLNVNNKKESYKNALAAVNERRILKTKEPVGKIPKFPKKYTFTKEEIKASYTCVYLPEIRRLVKRREEHIRLMKEAVELDWWRAINIEWKAVLRMQTVNIIEKIQTWREKYEEPDRIFKWHGMNYLLKIPSDLDFCSRRWTYCYAKDRNPFMLPFNIDDRKNNVSDVINYQNDNGNCRISMSIQVLLKEEEKFGRHKWDYKEKKLIQIPGHIYRLPPESHIHIRQNTPLEQSLPSRGSVGSKRSFRQRIARGTIETVFAVPQNSLDIIRASSRSSSRLQKRPLEDGSNTVSKAVPNTPIQIMEEENKRLRMQRTISRERLFSGGKKHIRYEDMPEITATEIRRVSLEDARPNTIGAEDGRDIVRKYNKKFMRHSSSQDWKHMISSLPPGTPPLPPRTPPGSASRRVTNMLTPPGSAAKRISDALRESSMREHVRTLYTAPASITVETHYFNNTNKTTPPSTIRPMSSASQQRQELPQTPPSMIQPMSSVLQQRPGSSQLRAIAPIYTPPSSSQGNRLSTPLQNRNSLIQTPQSDNGIQPWGEEFDNDQNILFQREYLRNDKNINPMISAALYDPKYLTMCPLPNCSVCKAIELENRVERVQTASVEMDVLSFYSSIVSQSVIRENYRSATTIQRYWRGSLIRKKRMLAPVDKVTDSSGLYINTWFPYAHECALKIQRVFRYKSSIWELKFRKKWRVWHHAAIFVQCLVRVYQAKHRVDRIRKHKAFIDSKATIIQCCMRSYIARKIMRQKREEWLAGQRRLRSIRIVQRRWRSMMAIRLVRKLRERKMAIRFQSFFRGYLTRERLLVNNHIVLFLKYHLNATNQIIERKINLPKTREKRYAMHDIATETEAETQILCKRLLCSNSSIARSGFQNVIKSFQKKHLFKLLNWDQAYFDVDDARQVNKDIIKHEQWMLQFKKILRERIRIDRLVGKILSVRSNLPVKTSHYQMYIQNQESTMRLMKNSSNIVNSMLSTTIKSWRLDASKKYMKKQYTSHAASVLATNLISTTLGPSGMQNAVEKTIVKGLIEDLTVWIDEKPLFEAEDKRSERYRGYLTANKFARLVVQEGFDDLWDKHDKKCGKTQVRTYNLEECCRILKDPLSKIRAEEALKILDPEETGLIDFEKFSVWWFSGVRSVPKGVEYVKLSNRINFKYRVARRKRSIVRGYRSIGFIKRRIKKKEKALKDAEMAIKMEERQKQMVQERKAKLQVEEDARILIEEEEKHNEEVRVLNKGFDHLYEVGMEPGGAYETNTRPPANALRMSHIYGRTNTSKKAMKKVNKKWIKMQKKKKNSMSKEDKKKAKEKAKLAKMSPEEKKKYMEKKKKKEAKEQAKKDKAAAAEVEKAKKKAEKRKKMAAKRRKQKFG